ncbi:MAG: ATP-binding protein [Pseudomonadota bacterium]
MSSDTNERKTKGEEWWIVDQEKKPALFRYHRLWVSFVISTCLVSLIPLIIMGAVNYYQYHKEFSEEMRQGISFLTSNAQRTLRFFLDERVSALNFIVHDKTFEELCNQEELTRIYRNLKSNHDDIVDVGVIDASGRQHSYVGPYGLKDKVYKNQDWFQEALLRGRSISDVFMGYRKVPHFAIAVRNVSAVGQAYILRATLNANILETIIGSDKTRRSVDGFILNHNGVLQTPSEIYGKILEQTSMKFSPPSVETKVVREVDDDGSVRVIGVAIVDDSPFVCAFVDQQRTLYRSWFALRNKLFWFLGISIVVIVVVILIGATYAINRIREADDKRLSILHKIEYTTKMASIGRLASGVAHEINNPLAIISEKAGLLKDILSLDSQKFPNQEKFEKTVDSILNSVDRGAQITQRLLRFAKQIDVRNEPINLVNLVEEVLGFMGKESVYRNLQISIEAEGGIPVIESDKGRLQQVFLNIINNAFGAVSDGGKINIFVTKKGDHHVSVTIKDNGVGIPKEHLSSIFEPFFTTKEKHGTGLGLSITYGLLEKLGGKITVDSQEGEWTEFTVLLPVRQREPGTEEGRNAHTIGG